MGCACINTKTPFKLTPLPSLDPTRQSTKPSSPHPSHKPFFSKLKHRSSYSTILQFIPYNEYPHLININKQFHTTITSILDETNITFHNQNLSKDTSHHNDPLICNTNKFSTIYDMFPGVSVEYIEELLTKPHKKGTNYSKVYSILENISSNENDKGITPRFIS